MKKSSRDKSEIQASTSHDFPGDCTGAQVQANDDNNGYAGIWLSCTANKQHTLTLVVDAGNACINFYLESTGLVAWLQGSSRSFNSGSDTRVFVFAGLKHGCGNPPFGTGAIRACQTPYGWLLSINSTSSDPNGTYDTTLAFYN